MKKNIFLFLFLLTAVLSFAQNWNPIGSGTNGFIANTIEVDSVTNEVYFGGSFTTINGVPARYIAKWDQTNFFEIGGGSDNPVRSIEIIDSNLWVGGDFNLLDSSSSPCIARFDGVNWNSVGLGFLKTGQHTAAASVYAIVKYNGDIYAGGVFDMADSMSAKFIARWDGSGWNAVGSGLGGTAWVYDMIVFNGELVVAGSFTNAGGVGSTANIAKWNGTNWTPLGGSADASVFALAVHDGELYAGGAFVNIGGLSTQKIAKWNGFSWAPVGSGMDADVNSLSSMQGKLYAGGIFSTAGGNSCSRTAVWDGTNWNPMGSGTNGLVFEYEPYPSMDRLYAAGTFTTAGGINASKIAYWSTVVGVEDPAFTSPEVIVFPSPASEHFTVRTNAEWARQGLSLSLYDLSGKNVTGKQLFHSNEITFSAEHLAPGMYLLKLEGSGLQRLEKIIIE